MSMYINPLHPPIPSSLRSPYTTLSPAHSHSQPLLTSTSALPPSLHRLPQAPPSSFKPHHTHCAPPITFDTIGASARGLGVPMRELLARSGGALERMVIGAAETVNANSRRATLRIMWPGYEHLDWSQGIEVYGATKVQLGVQVARAFKAFVEKTFTHPPAPHGASWRGVSFERLVLVALWNVCEDTWMAEVLVDSR
ncbi:hypothetical protein BV22DRAFT_1020051 [Leucogyrophana mollusca]|uniref:Uncharacterized protein n=1 Tax=Leucogyrophana mollusca TaxID=85980 RepID=A0ACB8B692_9AGAM|nr:hypothetical protein BV22DRAFT_1020051 [Leucogyrophana mollusca]